MFVQHPTRITPILALLATGLLAAGLACNKQDTNKQGSGADSPKHSDSGQPLGGSKAEATPSEPQATPVQPVVASNPPPSPALAHQTTAVSTQSPPPASTSPPPVEDQRQHAENLIYATIRIKMEEAIAERKKLLDAGSSPSDERVRQLEGTIMRARDLLTENGEVVDDVDPPIVQTAPKN